MEETTGETGLIRLQLALLSSSTSLRIRALEDLQQTLQKNGEQL